MLLSSMLAELCSLPRYLDCLLTAGCCCGAEAPRVDLLLRFCVWRRGCWHTQTHKQEVTEAELIFFTKAEVLVSNFKSVSWVWWRFTSQTRLPKKQWSRLYSELVLLVKHYFCNHYWSWKSEAAVKINVKAADMLAPVFSLRSRPDHVISQPRPWPKRKPSSLTVLSLQHDYFSIGDGLFLTCFKKKKRKKCIKTSS